MATVVSYFSGTGSALKHT